MAYQNTTSTQRVETVLWEVATHTIDHESIRQELLDLANKERTSLFPWRGQFSPELIELLLDSYASPHSIVLDPFVGSGTTLFEAAYRYHSSHGLEINPAAFAMASTVHFVNVPLAERTAYLAQAETLIRKFFRPERDLFNWATYQEIDDDSALSHKEAVRSLAAEVSDSPFLYSIVANTVMQYIDCSGNGNHRSIFDAFRRHTKLVQALPYRQEHPSTAFLSDARSIPLDSAQIDLVITSPPYINVFNYHQNYRRAMEALGWDLLYVARSEIGSNRKHRSNRFLTVVQYAIDMYQALRELHRVLKPNGRIIVVIGRESRVRGIAFNNALIFGSVAVAGAGFRLVQRQERKFTNKFGQRIFEDILHFVPNKLMPEEDYDLPRSIARTVLDQAVRQVLQRDVLQDILDAYEQAFLVEASPTFRLQER
ncbi:MAG: site-specific DNA-methyltransferase [Chloroflexi bacterium]|nr:site-specific DNA-methyltransferase [Chloroflexota bacterium]